jgi:hypothetical protein
MRSRQRQLPHPQSSVPSVPTTIFYRLPTSSQQQFAHLVAELIQRVRIAAKDKECDHER